MKKKQYTVGVIHSMDSREYTYLVTESDYQDLEEGDLALVKSRLGWSVVQIKTKHEQPDIKPGITYTWIVCRVPVEKYQRLTSGLDEVELEEDLLS